MGIVTPSLNYIYDEEVSYRSAVSEATATKQAGTVNYLLQNGTDVIGEYKHTFLTEAQFASLKGYNHTDPLTTRKWALCDGSSIVGSDFNTLTGETNLPDLLSNEAYLGQASSDSALGDYETSQNKNHTHTVDTGILISQDVSGGTTGTLFLGGSGSNVVGSSGNGGIDARPNTVRSHIFLKINN